MHHIWKAAKRHTTSNDPCSCSERENPLGDISISNQFYNGWNGAGIRNCRSVICIVNCFVKIVEYHHAKRVEKSVGVLFCGLAYFSDF